MSSPREKTNLSAALCAALSFFGCKSPTSGAAPSAKSGSAVAAAVPALPAAAPAAKPKPWFAGGFSGQYQAKLAPVEVKTGAVREWASDDGKLASGSGKLSLEVSDDGSVQGVSDGALGAGSATGKVEEDTLRVLLSPNDATGFHGVLVASREGDGFRGSIQASSSDSLQVRQATVELKRQAN
jgi:hypothetical protein